MWPTAPPGPPVTVQPQYNLLTREVEWEIVPVSQAEGLGLLPWSPLGGGWLTGKYHRLERPDRVDPPGRGSRPRHGGLRPPRISRRTWEVLGAVEEVAGRRGVSMPQVALAWLVDRPAVTSVILGARTLQQLDDNLGAAGLHLSEEESRQLDLVSDPGAADYPYGRPALEQRSRQVSGGR